MRYLLIVSLFLKLMAFQTVEAQFILSDDALKLKNIYEELLEFKNNPEFHQVGFGACCRFHQWLVAIDQFDPDKARNLLLEVGFVPDDLRMLGLEYMENGGGMHPMPETVN